MSHGGKSPHSQAQARLFGAVTAGVKTEAVGRSMKSAKEHLRGVKISKLPERAKKKKKK